MAKINKKWVQRRWLDFRNGHATYLVFGMTFLNFITIQYALAVQEIDALRNIDGLTFALVFIAFYIPAALVIGNWHMKRQVPKEQEQIMENNPYAFKTSPGKEQLYNLPGTIIGYELQLKTMHISNQIADAFKKAYNIEIDKWDEKEFKQIEWLRNVASRLQKGEDITSIVK